MPQKIRMIFNHYLTRLAGKYYALCVRIISGILLFMLFSGCITRQKKKPLDLVWPPPPDIPRIRYLKSIYGTEGIKKSVYGKIKEWVTGEKVDFSLLKPYGIFVDKKGKVYIADSSQGAILCLDFERNKFKVFGDKGNIRLKMPIGVFVDRLENVYVTDPHIDKVIVCN